MEAKDKVFKALKDSVEPMRPGDIATATGLDKNDVEKAIKVLKVEDKIHSPKRCFYAAK